MQKMRAGGASYATIARACGCSKSTVQEAFGARTRYGRRATLAPAPTPIREEGRPAKKQGRTLEEFRRTYDKDYIVPARVKAALAELGNGWEYEVQFARLAGVSLADLSSYRDAFAGHVVTLRDSRRAWAGKESVAEQMKGML